MRLRALAVGVLCLLLLGGCRREQTEAVRPPRPKATPARPAPVSLAPLSPAAHVPRVLDFGSGQIGLPSGWSGKATHAQEGVVGVLRGPGSSERRPTIVVCRFAAQGLSATGAAARSQAEGAASCANDRQEQLLDLRPVTLCRRPAYRLQTRSATRSLFSYFVVANGGAYTLVCAAPLDRASDSEPAFQQALSRLAFRE